MSATSYSLYLTHGLILPLIARLLPVGWIEIVAGIALSLALAAVTHHGVEKPSADWLNAMWRKRRLGPRSA